MHHISSLSQKMMPLLNFEKDMSSNNDLNDCAPMDWSETPILHETLFAQSGSFINNDSTFSNCCENISVVTGSQNEFTPTEMSLIHQYAVENFSFSSKKHVLPDISTTNSINCQLQMVLQDIENILQLSKTFINTKKSNVEQYLEVIDKLLIFLDKTSYNYLLSKESLKKAQEYKLNLEKLAFELVRSLN